MTDKNGIGILTLHSGFNEGAILQTFCLSKNLQGVFPEKRIEVVDHRYPAKTQVYGPANDAKKKTLDDFIEHGLPLSSRRFEQVDRLPTFDFINRNYQAVVTGSDELWKLKYARRFLGLIREQKDPWCPAFPNIYWPDENVEVPKFSYAASIGSTDWREIPRAHRERMKSALSGYTLLGVRDERTRRFLEWLDPKLADKSEWVPDPTFSIDLHAQVDKEALKKKLESYGVDFSRPRIATVLWDLPAAGRVLGELKEKGYQVVALTMGNKMADVALYDKGLTPLEWFGTFGFVDLCFSLRMHACISCILNETPVVAFDFYSNEMDDDSKLTDLFGRYELRDFHFQPQRQGEQELQRMTEDILQGQWPVDKVGETRERFQTRSRDYTAKIRDSLISDN